MKIFYLIFSLFFCKIMFSETIKEENINYFEIKGPTELFNSTLNINKKKIHFIDLVFPLGDRFLLAFKGKSVSSIKLRDYKGKRLNYEILKSGTMANIGDIIFLPDLKQLDNSLIGMDEKSNWKWLGQKEKKENKKFLKSYAPENEVFLINDFKEIYNNLKGIYGIYSGKKGKIIVSQHNKYLDIQTQNLQEDFGGIWMDLFPSDSEYIIPLDLSNYDNIIVQYKRKSGSGKIKFKLADKKLYEIEDSYELTSVEVSEDNEWKSFSVPLRNIPIDTSMLLNLVLDFSGCEDLNLSIGNIYAIKKEQGNLPFPEENDIKISSFSKGIYIWDTIEILENTNIWDGIKNKLKFAEINKIYLQIPYKINNENDRYWLKRRQKKFSIFLSFLQKNGFEIEFLDGWKGFSLEPLHDRVLNQIRNLKYFWNKNFESIPIPPLHLDIEPYLLRFYNSTNYLEIYSQYVNLLKKIKKTYPEIVINLDLPFWLDNLKGGEEILKDIIKYSDSITIMAYRSKIWGSNGIIHLTENEINLAKKENKNVFIAIETMELPSEKVYGIFEKRDDNFQFYLNKSNFENLFLISNEPAEYGIKIIEETPGDFISLYKHNWNYINNFAKEVFSYYNYKIDGISFHHFGSLKDKLKQ